MEASEALLSKALKIGCTITLCYKDDDGNNYYACCEGFTSMKLRLLTAQQIKDQGRLNQCLFKVVPPFQYVEYNKGKEAFHQKEILNQVTNVDQRDSRLEFPKQIKLMQDESQLNKESLEKMKGQSIFFGQTIQFIHQASNKYLSYFKDQGSDYESDSWKATLKKEHGEDTQFKFLASFSFQQETGGLIFDEDTVYIVSVLDMSTEPGLHASNKKKDKEKRELNVAPEKRSFWKLNIFSKFMNDELGYLSVFDVIWINYSETNLNMIVQKYSPDDKKKYLKFEKGQDSEQINQFIGDSNGMYVIENIDPEKGDFLNGGYVEWVKEYRLKHLTSNYYLKLEEIAEIQGSFRLVAVENISDSSIFQFGMIYSTIVKKDNQEFLTKDSYFRLSTRGQNEQYWLKIDTVGPNEIYKIEGDNFIEDITIPIFDQDKKDEHVFNLACASLNEVRFIKYLLSCMKILKRSKEYLDVDLNDTGFFKDSQFQEIYKKLIVRSQHLEQVLDDLYLLCHNKLEGFVSFDTEFGFPNQHTQNLLKEQYFFEILFQILVICFPTQESLKKADEPFQLVQVTKLLSEEKLVDLNLEKQIIARFIEKKKIICTKIFKLLQAMVIDNIANQEYCSKYLPILSMQSMYLNGAISTILAIIHNFEELLLNLNKDEYPLEVPQQILKAASIKTPQINQNKQKKRRKNEINKPSVDYNAQYKLICKQIKGQMPNQLQTWDLLMFFTTMLKSNYFLFNKKIEIMYFLKESVCFEEKGININQETAYKYILSSQRVFEDEILIRLKSDGPQLKVYRGDQESTLLDYYHKYKNNDDPKLLNFIPYVQELMRMYSRMCNSRNYTWKKFAENFFNVESLIENIQNNQYNVEIRSIICSLLNKLYVDQEPRRIIIWPELCKIVRTSRKQNKNDINNTMLSEGKQQNKITKTDPVDIPKVQEKINGYLADQLYFVQNQSDLVDLNKGPTERYDMLGIIFKNAPEIYNELTLEVIKLFKLLIQFGKYSIVIEEDEQKTITKNAQLFSNIRALTAILEYNSTYPEVRKILSIKRKEEEIQKNSTNLFGFGDKNKKQEEQGQVKQQYSGEDDAEDLSEAENFQKQVEFLSLRMNQFMYQQQLPNDPLIKLEVCEILDLYLDSKMDFYLNNLKLQFSTWVEKLNLFNDVFNGQKDIDNEQDKEEIQQQFRDTIKKNLDNMLPAIMKTGTKVDDEIFKKKEDNQLFNIMNIANLANKLVNTNDDQSKIKSLDAIELSNIISFSIFPSLISIFCLNQSLDLETKILHILTRFYNQRHEFADLSSKLLLLFDDTNITIFKKSKKKILVLAKCVDESETWVQNLDEPQNLRTLELVQQHFEFFTQLLFKGSYLNESQELEKGHEGQVDSIRQDMMRHLKVDKLGVDLIKDSVFMVEQEDIDPELQQKLKKMFQVCLTFLKYFCMNNLTNQNVMSQHIVALISKLNTDLGQVELLCEIFRDNKAVCFERSQEVIDDFVRLIITNGRRVRYLEFFLVIMQIKTEYISQNQKAVLNLFIDPRYKTQLFYMLPKGEADEHPIFDFETKFHDNPNYKDEPYDYHAKFIEVCAQCTIGKEGLLSSENKLKAQITFKYVMELLLEKDEFSELIEPPSGLDSEQQFMEIPTHKQRSQLQSGISIIPLNRDKVEGITKIKPSLLDLLFYTYLESEKISEEVFSCFDMIIQFIANEKDRIMKCKNFIPQFYDYFFSNLMLVLNGLVKVLNRELGSQALVQGSKLQKQSTEFYRELEELRNFLTESFTSQLQLSNRQKTLLQYFKDNIIMKEELNKQNQDDQKYQQEKERQKNRSRQASQYKTPKRLQTIQTSKRELSTDQIWKELWDIFLTEFLDSEELIEAINKEQMAFAKAISKVEEIFKKDKIVHQQINKQIIFQRLIAFLEKSSASAENITTFKLILNVLRNFIHIEDESEFTPDMDKEEKKTIIQRQKKDNQNFLNSNNAMQMTLTLLSDISDPINSQKIFGELIQFAIDLLDGGNEDIQRSIWNYFQNFTESETIFLRLHNEFQKTIKNMKKNDEMLFQFGFQKQPDIINQILRLLQLFAEGHYKELQEYMYFQKFNHHSHNLIYDFIDLLQSYMNAVEPDYFENMIQNFDTITEYIQGPCRTNQKALIEANFLDLANKLYEIDEIALEIQDEIIEDEEFLEDDNQELFTIQKHLPRWMIAFLKYKCSITLISLLEDREGDEIIQRIQKSISNENLKSNISNIFYMFQFYSNEVYDLKLFGHFVNQQPKTKEERNYCSFIIETGFNLFFIYQIHQKTKSKTTQQSKGEEEETDDVTQQLLNSPFYKLLLLVQNLIKSLQDSALQVAKIYQKTEKQTPKERMQKLQQARAQLFPKASKFFLSKTAKIEIMLESKNVEETYFYIPPYCQLDDDAKRTFNETANRNSNKAKVTSLVESSEEIIKTMKLNYKIQVYLNQIKTLQVIIENIDLLRDIEFIIALLINLFIFLFYKKTYVGIEINADLSETEIWSNDDNFEYQSLIDSLGILSIVLSILIVAFFLSRNAPLLLEKAWSGVGQEKLNPLAYLIRLLKTVYYLLSDFFALYYIMYGTAAVLGRFVHNFFFSFHLFEVMIRFPLLLNVVKSVWNPRKMILYTGLLLLIFMFVFTVFSYRIFYDSYDAGFCDSMWVCFLSTLDSAFKYDQGIGGFLKSPYEVYPSDEVKLVLRFIFDNFFNILVIIVMLNIVAGIIIDTFGELREQLQEYNQDLENLCFICGYDKETIEKESINLQNFSDHIKKEHYQWYYLFYIAYLREKDPTEYTGIESYVAGKLDSGDITWFPLNKALCLKKDFGNQEEKNIVTSLETIKENAQELKNILVEIQTEIEEED
ncbi:unnamed protein product [Paramecium sonneborni]|uniref:MIR domain protein n=1 Tax=Paramecium sonneborni TaxID=65129 RepID=A0A8S1Q7A0_9CILI|nr:unnamed protein product [Paramecium sonneborni]